MEKFKRILVPLDGSGLAEQALPLAATMAQKFGSRIVLLYAVDFLHPTIMAPHLSTVTASAMANAYHHAWQEAEAYLEAQQQKLEEQGLEVDIVLRDTPPATAILETAAAHEVEMIVMSTHGRGGLARWTLGSVADKVVHHGRCPVFLVRQGLEFAA